MAIGSCDPVSRRAPRHLLPTTLLRTFCTLPGRKLVGTAELSDLEAEGQARGPEPPKELEQDAPEMDGPARTGGVGFNVEVRPVCLIKRLHQHTLRAQRSAPGKWGRPRRGTVWFSPWILVIFVM